MSTILDVLNEDCWHYILDWLHTDDIIRSERVSKEWRDVIYRYLQGVGISIEYDTRPELWYGQNHNLSHSYRILRIEGDNPEVLKNLVRKWGSCIKKSDCLDSTMDVLTKNCPNLKDVTFHGVQSDNLATASSKVFKKLKRVHFKGCNDLTDKCVRQWLASYNLEELVIWEADDVTGRFLISEHSEKLKHLSFKDCKTLDYCHLFSAVTHLKKLNKLELILANKEVYLNVHKLLDQLPDLEDLCMRWEKMELRYEWAAAVGRLRLRRLDLSFNPNVNDELLEKASCGFGRLEELLLMRCEGITGAGVRTACSAAGAALRGLQLGSNTQLENEYVVDIVRACPNLVWIDLSFCHGITNYIVGEVANARTARAKKLQLIAECTYVDEVEEGMFPWLEVEFGDNYLSKNYSYPCNTKK
ncbi:F-box/LRR-repeat protein 16-like [Leguminivora glycinivorella]|uniref:F-box/LRR-repeat protein 16-like n=1 Tax=Leguminivora glycinivorella TaxID=1035111 RepID=UPI00201065A0|nr:F-box/LRR-repeat protein 16-like [Leguminivora glycinivorella]